MNTPTLKTNRVRAIFASPMKYLPALMTAAFALVTVGASAQTRPRSLCAANEEIVFSCDLQGAQKTVSLCASLDAAAVDTHFRYLYGRPSRVELSVSSEKADGASFSRSHLVFAGGTGGYAYSFTNDTHKYILYSISGARRLEQQGLAVQRVGAPRAASDRACKRSTVIETHDDSIRRATRGWKADPDIETHGLPSTR